MRWLALILSGLAAPACAEGVFDDASATGAMLTEICVTDSLDFAAIFADGTAQAQADSLPVVTETDKVAMYGHPVNGSVTFSREVDAIACALRLAPPAGSVSYFETLRDVVQARIMEVYPGALSVDAKLPSPHEEKHDWVFSKPADRHFAATLTWQTDAGILLAIGYRQIYD